MLGQQKEPVLNSVLNLIALSDAAPTITDTDSDTTSAIDAGVPKEREEILFLEVGTIANLDAGNVTLTESVDGGVYTFVCTLLIVAGVQTRRFTRKGRYLKAVTNYEFVQPDAEAPVASSIPLTLKVLR